MTKAKQVQAAIDAAKAVQAVEAKKLDVNEVANQATGIINACAAMQTANAEHKATVKGFEDNTGKQVLQLAQSTELGNFVNGMELAAKAWKAANGAKPIPAHFTQYKSDVKAGYELGVNFAEHATYSQAKKAINERRLNKKAQAEGKVTLEVDKPLKALLMAIVDSYHKDAQATTSLAQELMPKLQAILAALPAPVEGQAPMAKAA